MNTKRSGDAPQIPTLDPHTPATTTQRPPNTEQVFQKNVMHRWLDRAGMLEVDTPRMEASAA